MIQVDMVEEAQMQLKQYRVFLRARLFWCG
jgi:hypothetical protein